MDIGVLMQDNQIMDMIIKSNIVREMPIYNNLVRATLRDKMEDLVSPGAKAFRNAMAQNIVGR